MEQLDFFNTLEQTKPICPVCGNSFEKNKRKKYCSNYCFSEARKDVKRIYRTKNQERHKEYSKKSYNKNKEKRSLYNKEYHLKNKEKIHERKNLTSKIYREENKKKIAIQRLEYSKKNRKSICDRQKIYYRKNKKIILEKGRVYAKNNRDKINSYTREKYNKNVSFKISQNVRTRLVKALKRQKTLKRNKTVNLIGCSFDFLKTHLEKQFKDGMTWGNHGNKGWHIDHILPCASFDLTDPEQQKKCFHYTNLQPLWAKENISKGTKILW